MTIGASELARVLGISRGRVYQLESEGKISREKDGKYDIAAVRLARDL
jgi:DNA-binding XRE family transcriptional regulator